MISVKVNTTFLTWLRDTKEERHCFQTSVVCGHVGGYVLAFTRFHLSQGLDLVPVV